MSTTVGPAEQIGLGNYAIDAPSSGAAIGKTLQVVSGAVNSWVLGFADFPVVDAAAIAAALLYVPANDANVVHTTGDESIAGIKTFTDGVVLSSDTDEVIRINNVANTHYLQLRHSPSGGLIYPRLSTSANNLLIETSGQSIGMGSSYFHVTSGGRVVLSLGNDYAASAATIKGGVTQTNHTLWTNSVDATIASLSPTGSLVLNGTGVALTTGASTSIAMGAGSALRTRYLNTADNQGTMLDMEDGVNGVATFGLSKTTPRLRFGGSTSSFPSLKRVGTTLTVRLADDSADAPMTAGSVNGWTIPTGQAGYGGINLGTGVSSPLGSNHVHVGWTTDWGTVELKTWGGRTGFTGTSTPTVSALNWIADANGYIGWASGNHFSAAPDARLMRLGSGSIVLYTSNIGTTLGSFTIGSTAINRALVATLPMAMQVDTTSKDGFNIYNSAGTLIAELGADGGDNFRGRFRSSVSTVVNTIDNLGFTTTGYVKTGTGTAANSGVQTNRIDPVSQAHVQIGGGLDGSGFIGVFQQMLNMQSGGKLSWSSTTNLQSATGLELWQDASDTLAQRRGVNPQTFRLYNTWATAGVDYERAFHRWNAGVYEIGTDFGGTGVRRPIALITDGITRVTLSAGPNHTLTMPASSSIIMGSGSAIRLRYINAHDNAVTFMDFADGATGNTTFALSKTTPMFRFAGSTNAEPAIKRFNTYLQARLADDSGYTYWEASEYRTEGGARYEGARLWKAGVYDILAAGTDAGVGTFGNQLLRFNQWTGSEYILNVNASSKRLRLQTEIEVKVENAAGTKMPISAFLAASDLTGLGTDWPAALAAPYSAGGGSVATDAIWDAAGDLAVGSGANTAAKLPKGTALQVLRVNAGGTALEWADPASSGGGNNYLAVAMGGP